MISNKKCLNYKVVDLVESYNFHINFIPIRVHTKKLRFFREVEPTITGTAAGTSYSTRGGVL
jgi:hypothetical protein